ncbi:MAG: hypothetical protein QOG14_5044 [Mycobacterium sp.]|nr:hypothetical protein [Mycobacterium sp.]
MPPSRSSLALSILRCACRRLARSQGGRRSDGRSAAFRPAGSASFPITDRARRRPTRFCLPGGISSQTVAWRSCLGRSTRVTGQCRVRWKRSPRTGYEQHARWRILASLPWRWQIYLPRSFNSFGLLSGQPPRVPARSIRIISPTPSVNSSRRFSAGGAFRSRT